MKIYECSVCKNLIVVWVKIKGKKGKVCIDCAEKEVNKNV